MFYKFFDKKKNLYFYLFFLILFSFLFNQYYAFIGVLPVDSFSTFNGGYDVLNGNYPFKDFWTIKGSFLDVIQAIFYSLFGVSWFVYAAHASFFNSLFAVSTYFVLRTLNLEDKYCFYYSILVSILTYPTYGTPFTDHHASILSVISVYFLIMAIKTEKSIYWYFIPVIIFLSFFSKQAPTGYVGILIITIILYYLLFNFNKKVLINLTLGSITIILLFFFLIYFFQIPVQSIIDQQFLYPMNLGSTRLDWLFPLEFKRFILRFKLHYISLIFPIYILVKKSLENKKFLLSIDTIIIFLLIGLLLIFISHQLLTINGMFIFFLIPIFCGFSHIFLNKYKYNKNLIFFILFLSLSSSIHYFSKYIAKRDTLMLKYVDLNRSIDAIQIDKKLKNLKWITYHYPNNPEEEIKILKKSIKVIKNDNRKKMLVTDYQFISVILEINDNAAARIWWRHHLYPSPNEKYFDVWKKFLLKKIIKEKIDVIYTVHPLEGEDNVFLGLIKNDCYELKKINSILSLHTINKDCEELKNIDYF